MDFQRLLDDLKVREGTGPRAPNGNFMLYRDTKGILTIGYGYNIQVHGLPSDICERLLNDKAMEAHKVWVLRYPWFSRLNAVRQRVLVDMTYNMGNDFMLKWPIFLRQLSQGEYEAAARNMRSTKWYDDVGPGRADPMIYSMRTGLEPA